MLSLRRMHRDIAPSDEDTDGKVFGYFLVFLAGVVSLGVTALVIWALSLAVVHWGWWTLGIPVALVIPTFVGYGLLKFFGVFD